MELLDGKLASRAILDTLQLQVAQLQTEGKKIPHLTAVLVGNNGASETYVAAKVKACSEIGYKSTLLRLDAAVSADRRAEQ
jgi:methylenetetrahydrofolate dehydrogenase (NADP+) / methenyltetrahydrofolate cyclohydrolase